MSKRKENKFIPIFKVDHDWPRGTYKVVGYTSNDYQGNTIAQELSKTKALRIAKFFVKEFKGTLLSNIKEAV